MGTKEHSQRSPIDIAVGSRVRQRRRELGISAKTLAEALHVSSMQITNYETGGQRLAAASLHELSVILRVPIGYFFDDIPREIPPVAAAPATDGGSGALDKESTAALFRLAQLLSQVEDPRERALLREMLGRLADFTKSE